MIIKVKLFLEKCSDSIIWPSKRILKMQHHLLHLFFYNIFKIYGINVILGSRHSHCTQPWVVPILDNFGSLRMRCKLMNVSNILQGFLIRACSMVFHWHIQRLARLNEEVIDRSVLFMSPFQWPCLRPGLLIAQLWRLFGSIVLR